MIFDGSETNHRLFMGSEVLRLLFKMMTGIFWIVTPCNLVSGYHVSEKRIPSIFREVVILSLTILHGVTTQKTTIDSDYFLKRLVEKLIHILH
jgi:hypothetical protein